MEEMLTRRGTRDYRHQLNKPTIGGVEINGDLSLDDIGASPAPEVQKAGGYTVKIWPDDTVEIWYHADHYQCDISEQGGAVYKSAKQSIPLFPPELDPGQPIDISMAVVHCGHPNYPAWAAFAGVDGENVSFYAVSGAKRGPNPNYAVFTYIAGRLTKRR